MAKSPYKTLNKAPQLSLGLMSGKDEGVAQNDAKAIESCRFSAEQGRADAQCNLALMYRNGQGVEKNDATAVEWYRRSAAQGHAGARFNLGEMCENGRS